MGHGDGEQEYETVGGAAGQLGCGAVTDGQETAPRIVILSAVFLTAPLPIRPADYSSSANNPAAVSCGAATAGTSSIRGGGGS
jgi:hypothetical protein